MRDVELVAEDRVVLLLPGSKEYVDLVLRLLAAEIVPVPLDPRLTQRERDLVLTDIDPTLVVDEDHQVRRLLRMLAGARRGLPRARPMHVTSGTTGAPKAVWSGLLPPEAAAALADEERDLWGFRGNDVHLVLSPLYHSAPLRFAMGTLLAGGEICVPGPFDPVSATLAIAQRRPTTMFCVPTHLQRLCTHWDLVGVPDLSSFRLVAHAGAPCPPRVKDRLIELFPECSTWEFYGSTEVQFTACRSEEWQLRRGTVGRARPGRTLRIDSDGTIWCVVPEHARFTYWNAPEKTAAAWRETPAGAAFTVGDVGRLDEDGYLYLDGRREDLIISGGVNVYPGEVENVLGEHPSVRDIAVFGVEDDIWGQRVCAAVVGDVPAMSLQALAKKRLSPPKRPKEYFPVDALPRTSTGKARRLELLQLLGLSDRTRSGSRRQS